MEIKAFKAFRFDPAVTADAGRCIAPPYDVIDPDMQQTLYEANEFNIVRAIKGKTTDNDTETDNVYTRAGVYMEQAISKGALKQDEKPCIYVYLQDFSIGGQTFKRGGIIALAKLEDFGKGVQPHEKTLDGPKADRLNLTRATQAQFGQIFMLYDDPQNVDAAIIQAALQTQPVIDFTDAEQVHHTLYPVNDPAIIEQFTTMMADKKAVIADGHHRYETALNYWKESGTPQAAYRMMTLVNMRNEGLVIQPTHRLVANLADFDMNQLAADLATDFTVEKFTFTDETSKAAAKQQMFEKMTADGTTGQNIFGVYASDSVFYTATLKNSSIMQQAAPQMKPASAGLDVNVLHTLILDKLLGIGDKQLASQSHLEYIKDIGDAIDRSIARVDSGECNVVFFVNSTRIDQVQDVAAGGEKMPQKSTFFYPKIFTGLTINKL